MFPTLGQAELFDETLETNGSNSFAIALVNQEYDRELTYISSAEESLENVLELFSGLGVPDDQVFVLRDLDQISLEDSLADLGASIPDGARILFYFHGIGLHLTEEGVNRAALSGLRVRANSEDYLVRRRIDRASVSLQTLVQDLRRTAAHDIFVLYDACATKPFNGGRSAGYWNIVSRTPCVVQPIAGADILYGSSDLEQGHLAAALLAVVRNSPSISLGEIDAALKQELSDRFDIEDLRQPLFVQNPEAGAGALNCLVPSITENGVALCPAVRDSPPIVVEAPSAAVVAEIDASFIEDPKPERPRAIIVADSGTTVPETEAIQNAARVQRAWNTAKETASCEAYLTFLRDFPKSPFGLKAELSVRGLCSDEDREVFAQTAAGSLEQRDLDVEAEPESVKEVVSGDVNFSIDVQDALEDPQQEGDIVISAPSDSENVLDGSATSAGNDFKAWREARKIGTCEGFLSFRENFPGTAFSIRAEGEIALLCSDNQLLGNEAEDKETSALTPTPADSTSKEIDYTLDDSQSESPQLEGIKDDAPAFPDELVSPKRSEAHALLIVNDVYTDSTLPNIDVDADFEQIQLITDVLEIPSDQVTVLRNLDKSALEVGLVNFGQNLPSNADVLVYFSGHSLSFVDGGDLVVLPSDAQLPNTGLVALNRSNLRGQGVRLQDLSEYIRIGQPARLNIIYNGCGPSPLPKDLQGASLDFLNPEGCSNVPVFGATLLSAVSVGQVSAGSIFMEELADVLTQNPSIRLVDLGKSLAWTVGGKAERLGNIQVPVIIPDPRLPADQIMQSCLLLGPSGDPSACTDLEGKTDVKELSEEEVIEPFDVRPEPNVDIVQTDRSAWTAALQDGSCSAILEFIQIYPDSELLSRANLRVLRLCTEEELSGSAEGETASEEGEDEGRGNEVKFATEQAPVTTIPSYCAEDLLDDGTRALNRDGLRRVQARLNDLSCSVGGVDGIWGGGSQRGYDRFRNNHAEDWPGRPICSTLVRLEALATERVCPLVCGSGARLEGGRCVRIATPEPVAPSRPSPPSQPVTVPEPTPAPAQTQCKPLEKLNGQGKCVPRSTNFTGTF